LTEEERFSTDAAADASSGKGAEWITLYTVEFPDGTSVVQGAEHTYSKHTENTGFLVHEFSAGDGVMAVYYNAEQAKALRGEEDAEYDSGNSHTLTGCDFDRDVLGPAVVEAVDFPQSKAEVRFWDGRLIRLPFEHIVHIGEEAYENARDYIISAADA